MFVLIVCLLDCLLVCVLVDCLLVCLFAVYVHTDMRTAALSAVPLSLLMRRAMNRVRCNYVLSASCTCPLSAAKIHFVVYNMGGMSGQGASDLDNNHELQLALTSPGVRQ